MSQDPSCFSLSTASEFRPIRSAAIRAVSSAVSTPTPLIFNCTSLPLTSTCGARPGEKIRSLVFGAACSIDAMMFGVGGIAAASGTAVGRISPFGRSMGSPPPTGPGRRPARFRVASSMRERKAGQPRRWRPCSQRISCTSPRRDLTLDRALPAQAF